MTLTELRYLAALAEVRHFGRAAEKCHVSQPTLSAGIKSLEEKLGLVLCERRRGETLLTPAGETIAAEAREVLARVKGITETALAARDEFQAPFRLGAIYTVAPALLPYLVRSVQSDGSRLKLHLRENYTSELLAALREGALDSIILSPPFDMEGMHVVPLYDEAFVVAMPRTHPWTKLNAIPPASLANENVLLLTAGNCFRDQVLDVCPELRRRDAQSQSFRIHEGSSLSTIRQMVASGAGVTILPLTSVAPAEPTHSMLEFRPFAGVTPTRQIVLASRRNFPRRAALTELIDCLRRCELPNVTWRLQSSRSQAADVDQDPAAQRG